MRKLDVEDSGSGWGDVPVASPGGAPAPGPGPVSPTTPTSTQQEQASGMAAQASSTRGTMPPPPIIAPLVDANGMMTREWASWFRKQFDQAGGSTPATAVDQAVLEAYDSNQTSRVVPDVLGYPEPSSPIPSADFTVSLSYADAMPVPRRIAAGAALPATGASVVTTTPALASYGYTLAQATALLTLANANKARIDALETNLRAAGLLS